MLPWFLSKEFQELQILKCQYFSLDFDIKENYIFKKLHRGSEKSLWSKFHWCFFIKTNDNKNHENYVDNHYLTSRGQFFSLEIIHLVRTEKFAYVLNGWFLTN